MTFSILELALPGASAAPAGVLLFDEDSGRLGVKLRRDWQRLQDDYDLDEEDTALLASFEGEIKRRAQVDGGGPTLVWMEESLSNVFRLGSRQELASEKNNFDFTLHRLYRDCVPTRIEPFVTHLPRFALRSAAGPFGEQMGEEKNDPADWVEAPPGLRLSRDMFVAEVVGESMLPKIPSGSLCIFRKFGAGSRQGRMVLVEDRAESSSGGERYTVKIYHSEKSQSPDGDWAQQRIWLEALNPAYSPIELSSEDSRYAVVAEYVGLLDS